MLNINIRFFFRKTPVNIHISIPRLCRVDWVDFLGSGEFQQNCPQISQQILRRYFSANFSALFLHCCRSLPPPKKTSLKFTPKNLQALVSHYAAIGDTISCDAPYSAIGFRGKLFLRLPPCYVCLWIAIGHFYGKKSGCSSDSLRDHRKNSVTGVLLHLSRDRGAISVASLSFRAVKCGNRLRV